jgi:hypothetical protein
MRAENIHRLREHATAAEVSDVLALGAASVQSVAIPAFITEVRLSSSGNCWVAFGTSPTAAAADGSIYIAAGQPEYFRVSPGQKVAVIQDGAATGNLSVGFMTR